MRSSKPAGLSAIAYAHVNEYITLDIRFARGWTTAAYPISTLRNAHGVFSREGICLKLRDNIDKGGWW
jgi:hypothetical protein